MTVGESRLMHVLGGWRRRSKCSRCKRPIEWAIKRSELTAAKAGEAVSAELLRQRSTKHRAEYVSLQPGALVVSTVEASNGVRYDVVSVNAKHAKQCQARAEETRRPMSGSRARL